MATKNEHSDFFVVLKEPVTFRKGLLESMKVMIQQLQAYERFKDIRSTKLQLIQYLRDSMKDIDGLMGKLKQSLPKLTLSKAELDKYKKHYEHELERASAVVQQRPAAAAAPGRSEVDALADQLNDIEAQLSNLR